MFRTLARNVVWNWLGLAVFAGVTFFLTPFVLDKLGEVRYAVWALSVSITGYYGLVDLGLRGGINQYITRYLASEDNGALNRTASTVFVTLACIAVLIGVLSVTCGLLVPRILQLPDGVSQIEVFWCITLVGLSVAFEFLLFPFMCLLMSKQRYDLANVAMISARLFTAIGIWMALRDGRGLVAIAAITFGGNLLEYGLRAYLGKRLVPELRISPHLASWSSLREVAAFGVWSFLINAGRVITMHTTLIVIGAVLPMAMVAYYSFASRLCAYLNDLLNHAGRVIFPAATNLHARQDHQGLCTLYLAGTRAVLLVSFALGLIGWFWADEFYWLWIGDELGDPNKISDIANLFRVLVLAVVGSHISNIGRQVLLGSKNVKPLAIVTIVEALACVVLLVILIRIPSIGLMGAAIAQVVPVLLVRTVAVPTIVSCKIGVSVGQFSSTFARPLPVGIVLGASLMFLSSRFNPDGWVELIEMGCASTLIALVAIFAIGLTRDERQRAWRGGLRFLSPQRFAA